MYDHAIYDVFLYNQNNVCVFLLEILSDVFLGI